MAQLIFLLFILVLFLWMHSRENRRRINELESRIRWLETAKPPVEPLPEKKTAAKQPEPPKTEPVPIPAVKYEKPYVEPVKPAEAKPVATVRPEPAVTPAAKTARQTAPATTAARAESRPAPVVRQMPEFWVKMEKQLVENWTGILGSAILVMGIGFLGIYAALSLTAVFRFAMICGIASVFYVIFFLLRKRENWIRFASWMRSSCGAVLIFAFFGAGNIPGLRFIENPDAALVLLITGVTINLWFGYAGGTQYFASLHSLISLAGLAVAPQNHVTFITAGVVVLFSIVIAFKTRWDYHLLLTITSFFLYHAYWFFTADFTAYTIPQLTRISGIATVLAVGAAATRAHYSDVYKAAKFDTLPFIVHILNWAFLAIGLLFYSTGSRWDTIPLTAAVFVIFFLARHGKNLGIRWIYVTDILIAQSIALFAALTLSRWGLDRLLIYAIIYIEINIYLMIMNIEGEWILQKVGIILHHISSIILIVYALSLFDFSNKPLVLKNSVIIFLALVIQSAFHLYNMKRNGERFDTLSSWFSKEPAGTISISGFMMPVIVSALWIYLFRYYWGTYIIVPLAVFLLVVRYKIQSNGIALGMCALLPVIFFVAWPLILYPGTNTTAQTVISAIPVLLLSLAAVKTSYIKLWEKHLKWIGIYSFTITLVILIHALLKPVSVFLTGTAWLTLSVIYLEAAQFLRRKHGDSLTVNGETDRFILHAAYSLIVLFAARHFMVEFQSGLYIGQFSIRLLIELYAIAVFIYWAMAKKPAVSFASWRYLHPLFWELAVVTSMIIVVMDTGTEYRPLIWTIYALCMLGTGNVFAVLPRFRIYSVFLFWFAAYSVIFTLDIYAMPSETWLTRIWVSGMCAIGLQLIYIILFYKHSKLDSIEVPEPLLFLKGTGKFIVKHRNLLIYYFFTAEIILGTIKFFNPVSPFIPGVLWLVFSIVFLELARHTRNKYGDELMNGNWIDSWMLNSGYILVAAFIARHFLVHMQSGLYLGSFQVKLLIEIFATAVFLYWAMASRPEKETGYFSWNYLHPLMWELSVASTMMIIINETQDRYHPILWIIAAMVLLGAGKLFKEKISRMRFYSLVFHWVAMFTVTFLLASYSVPSLEWYEQVWVWGSIAIVLQFIYIMFFYTSADFDGIDLPQPVKFLEGIIRFVNTHRNLAVYYPFFISIAIFIYRTMDVSIHTLLWVLESFAIFVVSVILKENHFRYLSMGILAVCLTRLMYYDMAKSGTMLKGVVLVCIGLLMLGMNTIYNRYRDRF